MLNRIAQQPIRKKKHYLESNKLAKKQKSGFKLQCLKFTGFLSIVRL